EWAPHEPEALGTQSWTVTAEDSLERLLPPEPARPYACREEPEPEPEPEREESPSVFTCIECSIYFGRKEHLLEHMLQHSRGNERGDADTDADAPAGRRRLRCGECGWAFAEAAALERHRRLHQESREKIIEEIQKLDELPDEGREARLQCPKCIFGTNSSKIFVQHAKMHVKERKEHASRSAGLFGELRDGAGRGLYKPFPAEEPPAAPAGKAPSSCALCGFPAPTEHVLKEHLRYAHSHLSWRPEGFEDDPNQPGTSRDSYGPGRPGRFGDAELFGKAEKGFAERLLAPPCREGSALYEPGFALGHPRLDKSDVVATKKEHARKAAPFPGPHQTLGFAGFSSAKALSHSALQQLRRRAATQQPEG
ncbi:WIZ protein, partial [Chloropsis hardwickii]|nr:WIZ protein [Chloropsis hardwickii]